MPGVGESPSALFPTCHEHQHMAAGNAGYETWKPTVLRVAKAESKQNMGRDGGEGGGRGEVLVPTFTAGGSQYLLTAILLEWRCASRSPRAVIVSQTN